MNAKQARGLLDRILRHPSDIGLWIFCARYPRALMASEQLTIFQGGEIKEGAIGGEEVEQDG